MWFSFKKKPINMLTSLIFWTEGAAMNTTKGEYSAVRSTLRAWGSTSKMATFPSECILRIVSSFVPYMASSWVPNGYIKHGTEVDLEDRVTKFAYHIPSIRWLQCLPSSRHARRKSSSFHFPRPSVAILSYLSTRNEQKLQDIRPTRLLVTCNQQDSRGIG